jgi:hypothetical protein
MAIILPSGFNITNNEPIDARITLANESTRYALSFANVYEGLIVFQQDNNTIWVLTDTSNVGNSNGWTQLQIGSVSSNLPSGVVSSSQQIEDYNIFVTTSSFNTISQSFDSRIDSLEGETHENPLTFSDTTTINFTRNVDTITASVIGGVVSGSSQIIDILSSLNSYTSSNDTTNTTQNSRLDQLSTYTSSNDTTNTTQTSRLDQLSTASGSAITRLNLLEVETANLEAFTSSIDTTIKTKLNADGVLSGSSQVVGILSSLNTYTASNDTTNTTQNSRLDQLSTASGSAIARLNTLEMYTASNDTKWSTLGSLSGSFARTNSANTFNGNQTITGSLFISQDLIVQGSSSIQNISSSALVIGTNLITLNTFNPGARFAGISVIDSGSSPVTSGSFLYDSVQDEFIFVHRGNGINTTSSVVLMGPETIDNIGNEVYLTNNRIPKGSGKEHLNDSNISDSGTLITLNSNSQVNGNLVVNGSISANNLVSGSSQITMGGDLTGTADNAQIASGVIVNDDVNASAGIVHTKLNLNGSGIISGSSQISYPGLSNIPAGIVSGSSQIDLTATTNYVSGIKTRLNAEGVISGSSQVTRTLQQITDTGASTTNAITITNSTASTSKTTGALIVTGGIGTSGDIFAGGDVVAYASSDRRLKDNIELISNPLQKINKIGGYSFEWNEDKQNIYKGKDYGVIAQEIEEILPELVENRDNGYKAVKYDKLVSLLIEGIKDLSKQVEELNEKINRG